jgi:hypothetical protein
MGLDDATHIVKGRGSDHGIDLFAPAKEPNIGNSANANPTRQGAGMVHIDFKNQQFLGILAGQCDQGGGESTARAAPIGVEIDHHEAFGVGNQAIEVVF